MPSLAPGSKPEPAATTAETKQQILDKLTYWAEHRREWFAGTNTPLTLQEINTQLDKLLDALSEVRGR